MSTGAASMVLAAELTCGVVYAVVLRRRCGSWRGVARLLALGFKVMWRLPARLACQWSRRARRRDRRAFRRAVLGLEADKARAAYGHDTESGGM